MDEATVRATAFAMPLTSPAYPPGPYRFVDREYLTISYRTDPATLPRLVPQPLRPLGDTAAIEFIRMPDSTGFGDYSGVAQTIPVALPDGTHASYVHAMFLNVHPPIAGGRELWGFPQKLGRPSLRVEHDTLVGTLSFGPVPIARGTMGFKHRTLTEAQTAAGLHRPGVLLKVIPHVDGSPRICELVRVRRSGIAIKGGWTGPAALELHPHALAPIAELPVLSVLSATHLIADFTLELGEVIHDYLASAEAAP
jgi:acetoacetate decarboxylase